MGETTYVEFPFKTKPYQHQLDCWRLSKDLQSYGLFLDMGCVSGEAEIQLNWFGNSRKISLHELYLNGLEPKRRVRSNRSICTRSFNNGTFRLNRIVGILDSGLKDSLTLNLYSGKSLDLTPDHEVLTTEGWIRTDHLLDTHEVLTQLSRFDWNLLRKKPAAIIAPCAICRNPHSTTTPKSRYFGWCRSCIMKHISKHSDGYTIDKDGYVRIGGNKHHPRSSRSGQVLEHVLVMEKILGRSLSSEERIHHKDRNPKNNSPENLELTTKATHHEDHEWFKNLRQDVFVPVPDKVKDVRVGPKLQMYDVMMESPNNSFIANGMVVHNCGKSKVIIDTAAHLFLNKRIEAQVIVAPKGVYRGWEEDQIPTHMSEAVPSRIAHWSSSAKKKELEAVENLYADGDFLRTLVFNVEALNSERAVKELVRFMKRYRCMMTVDESTTLKNYQAKRTKVGINVGQFAHYRRICTGNPIPNGPMDLYAQSEFLQKNMLGFANFFGFRNRFAVMQDNRFGNKSFRTIVGYRDLAVLQKMMGKFSFIIKKEDCLDLPPKIYQTIDVEMGPKQREAYDTMVQDAIIQLECSQVTAPMVITQLLRLHQIACGYLAPDHGDPIAFDEPNDRLDEMMAVLEQAPGKAIIWATYKFNVLQIVSAISKRYGADSVVHYYGDTDPDSRMAATRSFQDPDSGVRWIVSNPSTGKFGNTWTQGTTVIYYSNSYDLESRSQSEDRSHRIGQTKPVLYVDLRCRGTVDDKIIKVLKNKKKLTDEIVASNWRWLLESST